MANLEQTCATLVSKCVEETLRGRWLKEGKIELDKEWIQAEGKEKRRLFIGTMATRLRALAAIGGAESVKEIAAATDYEEIKMAVREGILDKDDETFLADSLATEEANRRNLRAIHVVRVIAYLEILKSMPELRNPVPENLDEIRCRRQLPNSTDKWAAFWQDLASQIEEEIPDGVMEILPKIEEALGEKLQQKAYAVFDHPEHFEIRFNTWYSDPEFKKDFFETFNRVLRLILRRARHLPKGISSLNGRPFDFGRRPIVICRQALDNFAINQIIGSFVSAGGKAVHLTEYAKERGLKAIVSEKGLTVIDTKSSTTMELGKEPKLQKTSRYMPYLHLQLHRWVQAAKEHSVDSEN